MMKKQYHGKTSITKAKNEPLGIVVSGIKGTERTRPGYMNECEN